VESTFSKKEMQLGQDGAAGIAFSKNISQL
jgi:hypothetical protein